MADKFYDSNNPLPAADPAAPARLMLVADDSAYIGLTVYNGSGLAIQADDPANINIGRTGVVRGTTGGLEILAKGTATAPKVYHVLNEGSISAASGYGIKLTEGDQNAKGALSLINTGSINTSGVAVIGGSQADRIVNKGVILSTGPDAIDLGQGDDIYDGTQGVTVGRILLGEGNDMAYGGSGADHFVGGAGNDHLDGGTGSDTADYSGATSGITVNLTVSTRQTIGGGQGEDTLISIENVVGGDHGDTLTGNSSDNRLEGGKGNDVLEGGLGNDVLDGGEGEDTIRFGSGNAAVTVDLTKDGQQNTGYGYDTIINVENVEGGSGADEITGDEDNNKLYGYFGNDKLVGGAGSDTLEGSAGDDTLQGGEGNDVLRGDSGNDTAVFSGDRADYTIKVIATDGTETDYVPGSAYSESTKYKIIDNRTGVGSDGTDLVEGVRVLKFDDETFTFVNTAPTAAAVSGTGINENSDEGTYVGTLSGTDADGDKLTFTLVDPDNSAFSIDAQGRLLVAKKALLNYEATEATANRGFIKITVMVTDGLSPAVPKDILVAIKNVAEDIGVARYGTNGTESITGENGSDRIYGWGGNDTINAGTGNDVIYGGAGNDRLTGGAGYDIFVFDNKLSKSSNVDIITDFNSAQDTIYLSRKIFSKITKKGYLTKSAFKVGNSFDKDDKIVYQKSSGGLFYDADGSGSKYKYVQFGLIQANLSLSYKDFIVF